MERLVPTFHPVNDAVFEMKCDVFGATESQDKFGKIVKAWSKVKSDEFCQFYTPMDDRNNEDLQYDDKKFYKLETLVIGRTKTDIRQGSDINNLLITNIRAKSSYWGLPYPRNQQYFLEPDGTPTVFEIHMHVPYIGIMGIEYYKTYLSRHDNQRVLTP